jgi:hypothetical protein
MVLDPETPASIESAFTPEELAVLTELCMSMGTRPSSKYAQRYTTELMHAFEAAFDTRHRALYARWASEVAAFNEWRGVRARVAAETGRPEDR